MKIKPYLEKLSNSKEYKDFAKKYNDAYLVAGFFILDFEEGKNVHQIDYFIPSKKKIAAFTLDKDVNFQLLNTMNSKTPIKLDLDVQVDLDALQGILQDEMKNRSITDSIKKIIAIIQNIDGKTVWNLNCILSGMGILRAHVEDKSQTVLKMEKVSLLDYVKKVPANQLNAMKAKGSQPQNMANANPEDMKEELKKLDKLEDAIKKERDEIEQQLAKKEKAKDIQKDIEKAVKTIKKKSKK